MSFLTAMQNRYTTKNYDSTRKIDPATIGELQQILRLTPSSINSQPWKFVFVSDPEIRKQLSGVSWHNTQKVLDCDTVVVFTRIDQTEAFEAQIERELPEGAVNYYREFIKPMPEEQIKAWFNRQVYLAVGVLLSACAEMGIDSTPMEGLEPEKYDRILDLDGYATVVAVAIGYRDPSDFNQPDRKPKSRMALERVVRVR